MSRKNFRQAAEVEWAKAAGGLINTYDDRPIIRLMSYHHYYVSLAITVLIAANGCIGPAAHREPRYATADNKPIDSLRLAQARSLQEQGLLDAALAAFGRILEGNPRLPDAHVGMGSIFRQHGELEMAASAYKRAVALDPQHFNGNYYLGLMHQLLGRITQAIFHYRRALATRPNSFEANRDMASALVQSGDPTAALPFAKNAVSVNHESQAAWCNLATCHSLLGNYSAAVDAYREAAEPDTAPPPLLPGLANAHLQLGNYQRAIHVLRSLAKQSPSPAVHERLGYALFKTHEFEESLQHYETALALSPDDTAALNGIGACLMTLYLQSDRKQTELRNTAFEAWRRSVKLRPEQINIVDLLARYSVL